MFSNSWSHPAWNLFLAGEDEKGKRKFMEASAEAWWRSRPVQYAPEPGKPLFWQCSDSNEKSADKTWKRPAQNNRRIQKGVKIISAAKPKKGKR